MKIECRKNRKGLTLIISDGELKGRKFSLVYSGNIWQNYPPTAKGFITDNLAHLMTITAPLVAETNELKLNTSMPLFKPFFDSVILKSIPHAVDDYRHLSTNKVIEQFLNTKYEFADGQTKKFKYDASVRPDERAVVALSFGKDSLLTLAVCNEIGLEPTIVYIDDTVSPSENRIKKRFTKKIAKEFGLQGIIIRNEIEKINDFETWNKEESLLGYMHMVDAFIFISLPIAHYYKSKYIVIGSEHNLDFRFINKDGFVTSPSYDQTREWMAQQNRMMKMMGGKQKVVSVIEPITSLAIVRVFCARYPEFAKYMVSCDSLDASDEPRWCNNCSMCAQISLFMLAGGFDSKSVGIRRKFLNKGDEKFYAPFGMNEEIDIYDKGPDQRDQQLLAFLLAIENGARGYVIDKFKKELMNEAKSREDELRKKFFSVHKSTTMPKHIKKKVFSIYKEELSNFK